MDIRTHITSANGGLYGAIKLPRQDPPYPLVLILPGSGPVDRDGNCRSFPGKNDCYKLLARELAAKGIATCRFDKRGVGENAGSKQDQSNLLFEVLVQDALSWCRRLLHDDRFDKIVIMGHSEGALIGILACQKQAVHGFISLAGAGLPADQVFLWQVGRMFPKPLMEQTKEIVRVLLQGKKVENIPRILMPHLNPESQPFLISKFKYDPAVEINKLDMPVLIIHGTTDAHLQTTEAQILHQANQNAKIRIIRGMNHLMKQIPYERQAQIDCFNDPKIPVMPELVKEIAFFIEEIACKRNSMLSTDLV